MNKSFIFFCLCGWITLLLPAPNSVAIGQENQQAAWTQFGHTRNWQTPLKLNASNGFSIAWNEEVGAGRSQVVGIDDRIYITTGEEQEKDGKATITTQICAIDAVNGMKAWSYQQSSEKYQSQENFSGATISPQATPAIAGSRLIAISFTGQLTCLNRNEGKLIWEKDLVKDFGATPVQFGFSSSPVVDPDQTDRVYVLAAGQTGGLYCLNVDDGSMIWKSDCDSFSYATPDFARFGDTPQLIVVSQDEILGIATSDGSRLWQYPLAEKGLTNVPTPLVVDKSHLIVSGQGCKGTRCLLISQTENQWQVKEQWFERSIQFFYTNWVKLTDRIVVGCTDKYLAALDVGDGSILGRWRGYSDGNIVMAGPVLLLLDGKGKLNILDASDVSGAGITASQQFRVLEARCWTPISVVGNRVFVRGNDRLACLGVNQADGKPLENSLTSPKLLEMTSESSNQNDSDPVEKINQTFQTKGQQAALALYQQLRSEDLLDEDARITLAEGAHHEGLTDVTQLILNDALKDFPDSKKIQSAAESLIDKR